VQESLEREGLEFVWRFTIMGIVALAAMVAVAVGIFLVVRRNSLGKR
jgi:hypothetical protein